MIRIYPFIFILLWSSAFITTKPIVDNSDPFAALAFRFFFVAIGFYSFSIFLNQSVLVKKKNFIESVLSGVLFHGFYLGGVFFSISIGMPAGIAALIVTLQPILTNLLSGPILNEKVTFKQWIGAFLGFIGASLVLGLDMVRKYFFRFSGYFSCFNFNYGVHYLAKKLSNNLPLSVSNFYQALGGCLFHVIIVIFFAKASINFSSTFL